MKIALLIGSGRKHGNTYRAAQRIADRLSTHGDVTIETIYLSEYAVAPCIGCRACFNQGETRCPHKDDVSALTQKLLEADGVVFASPTYVCSMSGLLKNFFDRIAYFCHRPAFFGKAALIVTTTAGAGAGMAAMTVRMPLGSMGYTVAGTAALTLRTGEIIPLPEKEGKRLDRLADALYRTLISKKRHVPTLFSLVSYYVNRRHYTRKDTASYDHDYFAQKGWLEHKRAYYTDAKPSLPKKWAARLIASFL